MESLQALLQVGDVCGEGRKGLGGSRTLPSTWRPLLGEGRFQSWKPGTARDTLLYKAWHCFLGQRQLRALSSAGCEAGSLYRVNKK